MGTDRSSTGPRMGRQRRWQDVRPGVVWLQLQFRYRAMARGHSGLGALGKPNEPAERVPGRSMARFSRWHSIPPDQGRRCTFFRIFEYAEYVFRREDTHNLILESQHTKTDCVRLAFIGDLYRNRDNAPVGPEATQSCDLHPRRPVHIERSDLSHVFYNRQYEPAPPIQHRASRRWTVNGVCIGYGLWRYSELQRHAPFRPA